MFCKFLDFCGGTIRTDDADCSVEPIASVLQRAGETKSPGPIVNSALTLTGKEPRRRCYPNRAENSTRYSLYAQVDQAGPVATVTSQSVASREAGFAA